MKHEKPVEKLSYEQALGELEEVVNAMENEQHPLDQVLALYERGQKLAQHCAALLNLAELKVQQISGDELLPFETPNT